MAEGEDGLCLTVAEEEVDTDAFDEELSDSSMSLVKGIDTL
jgi:hypothetical protein